MADPAVWLALADGARRHSAAAVCPPAYLAAAGIGSFSGDQTSACGAHSRHPQSSLSRTNQRQRDVYPAGAAGGRECDAHCALPPVWLWLADAMAGLLYGAVPRLYSRQLAANAG